LTAARDSRGRPRTGLTAALLGALALRCASSPPTPAPERGGLPAECRTHPPLDPAIVPPRLIHRVDPEPGPGAASPVLVCLAGTVTARGALANLRVVRSAGAVMDAAALAAARQWQYLPATRDGVAIEVPIDILMTLTARS
jgi:TonB family protein